MHGRLAHASISKTLNTGPDYMKLSSQAVPTSEQFQSNRAAHLDALSQIEEAAAAARMCGGEKSRARH